MRVSMHTLSLSGTRRYPPAVVLDYPAAPQTPPFIPPLNRFVAWLLRSPFHRLASGRLALLAVIGRKSGHVSVFPVRYALNDDTITIAARKLSRWWLNLAGGADVMLLIKGKPLPGTATLATNDLAVAAALRSLWPRIQPARIAARLPWRVAINIQLNGGSTPLLPASR
jgi:hypothetical protein